MQLKPDEDAGVPPNADADAVQPPPPPAWHSLPCVMGIDEAGRGPVLGPMVYGAAWAPLEDKDAALKGVDDSKKLAEGERDRLFEVLERAPRVGFRVESLSASHISRAMLGKRNKTSLNVLAFDATRALIQGALDEGVNVASCFVDTVGDAGRWREKLLEAFPFIEFTVCPKADALYPIVSAASIVAKCTRDREVEELQRELAEKERDGDGKEREGGKDASGDLDNGTETKSSSSAQKINIGSGYPSDPATKAFLESSKHPLFGWGEHVRFSWSTAARALAVEEGGVAFEWEDDDENDENEGKRGAGGQKRRSGGGGGGTAMQQGRLSFAGGPAQPVSGASTGAGRASFFRARRLQVAVL